MGLAERDGQLKLWTVWVSLSANPTFSIDKGQAWVETGIENKRFVRVVKSERERQLHVAVLLITMILSRVRKILFTNNLFYYAIFALRLSS